MPTYRLDLAYVGSSFHGYARQPGRRTVQGVLEEALFHHTGPVETLVAGRTDKGVHAAGQVVSFATDEAIDTMRALRSLNRQLAPEAAVKALTEVPDAFHARFSAISRRYRYAVLTSAAPDPFLAATSWHFGRPLAPAAMNEAASHFVGERDFASLCRRAGDAPTMRRVIEAGWRESQPELAVYVVVANSFCHQMVRSMVAICVDAGRGKIEASSVAGMLEARDRNASRGAAPAHGLTLVEVGYDE